MSNIEKRREEIEIRTAEKIENVESVILINSWRSGELDYGYCEYYDVFIGWDEDGYYLVNEHVEIIKELPNMKLVVGEYYNDEY